MRANRYRLVGTGRQENRRIFRNNQKHDKAALLSALYKCNGFSALWTKKASAIRAKLFCKTELDTKHRGRGQPELEVEPLEHLLDLQISNATAVHHPNSSANSKAKHFLFPKINIGLYRCRYPLNGVGREFGYRRRRRQRRTTNGWG